MKSMAQKKKRLVESNNQKKDIPYTFLMYTWVTLIGWKITKKWKKKVETAHIG